MTQRLESFVHAALAGVLGIGTAAIVMLAFDVLRHGAARPLNWGTAVVLGMVMAVTRYGIGRRRRRGGA